MCSLHCTLSLHPDCSLQFAVRSLRFTLTVVHTALCQKSMLSTYLDATSFW